MLIVVREATQAAHGGVGEQAACVQSALGMGDDIYLAAAGRLHNLADAAGQLVGALAHGGGAIVVAVVYGGAVFLQLFRDPAPVIQVLEITEKDAVHQQQRVGRPGRSAVPAGRS